MKKTIYAIATGLFLFSASAYSNLPDVSEYWRAYNRKDYAKAEDLARDASKLLHDECKQNTGNCPTVVNVTDEDWLNLYLMRFYMQYMQNDSKKMKATSDGIRFLARKKFPIPEKE